MSTQAAPAPAGAAASRPARSPAVGAKAVAKTADFKGALARAQAPFSPGGAPPSALAARPPSAPARAPAPTQSAPAAQAQATARVLPRVVTGQEGGPGLPRVVTGAEGGALAGLARRPPPAADPRSHGGADPFRDLIAALESGAESWRARNAASGALGRYQFLSVAFRDIGWQDASGRWTERAAAHGVRSEGEFLGNPAAQEAAMGQYLDRKGQQLSAAGALSAVGRVVTDGEGRSLAITEAGLLAAAHRRGAGTVARWLDHRTRTPEAPVPPALRTAFANVEQRLRDFGGAEMASAARPRRPGPA